MNCTTPDKLTSLDLAKSTETMRLLLKHGAVPTYKNAEKATKLFQPVLRKDPEGMSIKLFFLGNPGSGKSTLAKSIAKERKGFKKFVFRFRKVRHVAKNTAGIIPHDIHSKYLGNAIIFDLAGHREFYAGHEAVLSSSMAGSPSVVMMVVDMRYNSEKFEETLRYWLKFINNISSVSDQKPHIIIVGSHADKSRDKSIKAALITSVVESEKVESFFYAGNVLLDCRYAVSSQMSALRSLLTKVCQVIRSPQQMAFTHHCFLIFLLDNFKDHPAITLDEAKRKLNEVSEGEVVWTFLKFHNLFAVCDQLNNYGSILFLRNTKCPNESWIVLDKDVILSDVNGTLFAPEHFREYKKIASNTGVVSLSKLVSLFPTLNPHMICRFLCYLEFCQEITDHNVLSLFQADVPISVQERYFLFPGLVQFDTPSDLWQPNSDLGYNNGWLLQCTKKDHFLSSKCLQVLLLRLAFGFALASYDSISDAHPTLNRKCKVWRNGLSWLNRSGVEAIVEVINQKHIIVMTRCVLLNKMELLRVRSAIIRKVLDTVEELCPDISVIESFILPDGVNCYPLNPEQVAAVDVVEVARAVKEDIQVPFVVVQDQLIQLEKLLYFEPYAGLGERVLQQLFDRSNSQHVVKLDFLLSITDKIPYSKVHDFIDVLKTPRSTVTSVERQADIIDSHKLVKLLKEAIGVEGTYCNLQDLLNQYSVFAGRNPLEVSTGL